MPVINGLRPSDQAPQAGAAVENLCQIDRLACQSMEDSAFAQSLSDVIARAEEAERAERERAITVQVEQGRCDLSPMPEVPLRPFRSPLTVEQQRLFVSNQFQGNFVTWEAIIKHPETGEPIQQRVTVGKVDKGTKKRGVLTQVHQDVYYRLLELWGQQGYPLLERDGRAYGMLRMTAYELVTALRAGDDSEHGYGRSKDLVRDLAAIPITMENLYTRSGMTDSAEFTLLHGVEWREKKVDPQNRRPRSGGISEVVVTFSSFVTASFLQKRVKTLLAGPYEELGARTGAGTKQRGRRAEVARLLYPFLDSQLATKDEYHSRVRALAQRFELTDHQKKAYRRRQFEPAVRALDGKVFLGERYRLRVSLRDDKEGDDLILEARREPIAQPTLPGIEL